MKLLTLSKGLLLLSTCALFSFSTHAQVGVNTTTPINSTALDITSTDKGFLMTRVALTGTDDLTTITPSPTTGLLVYNTTAAGGPGTQVSPGFYYYNGASWRRFYTQGYVLPYIQTAEVLASTTNTTYTILPGLDTNDITVPFSGIYQIRVEGYYSAGDLISNASDGAAQGSISLAMSSSSGGGGGSSCTGGITTYPYNESFENTIGLWTQSTADDINWRNDRNGTPTTFTGPSSGSDGDWYMYIESSGNGAGFPNKRAIFTSPCFDLTAAPAATFSFDYHMFGSTMGSLALQASNDDGVTWNTLWSQSGNQGNSWFSQNVDLEAYLGSSVQLRFNGVTASSFRSDMAIDNVSLGLFASGGGGTPLTTMKETYLTTSSKRLGSTTVNNLAQSASIIVNLELIAGDTYRFAVRGREWLPNNALTGIFGKDTSGYSGNTENNAQRGTMTISLIKQY